MLKLINILVFSISFLGFCLFLNKRLKISLFFCPIICLSAQVCFLLLIGMFIPLNYLSYFLIILGLILFIYSFRFEKNILIYVVALLIISLLIVLRTRGQFLKSHDNFTHWATVIKTMLISNRLPNMSDIFVDFKTYPLGSSIWSYFVSRIVKDSEGIYMYSKQLIIVYSILPLFEYLKEKKYIGLKAILIVFFLICASSYQIPIDSLLVDGLLGIVSISLFVLLSKNSNNYFNVFVAIFLTQIKKSGILFLAIIYLLIFIKEKYTFKKASVKKWLLLIVPVIVFVLIWKIHLNIAFTELDTSQQAFSLKLISANLQEKSSSDLITIFKTAINRIFYINYNTKHTFVLPLCLSIFSIFLFRKKDTLYFCIAINALYYIYTVLVLLMFILSMPLGEALVLSCFPRYMLSIALLIIGLFVIYFIENDFDFKKTIIVVVCFIVLSYSSEIKLLFNNSIYDEVKREKFARMIQYYEVEKGEHYLIIDPEGMDSSRTFTYWSLRYDLWSSYINVINENDNYDLDKQSLEGYQYLIIVTPSDISNQYLHSINKDELMGLSYIVIDLANV